MPETRPDLSVEDYAAGVRAGDRSTLGRALTLVESNHPQQRRQAQDLLALLQPASGGAWRLGISGVPGVGKSTFIESLGLRLVDQGRRVAVLAVDPSSAVSGGSILGDKTRMPELSTRNHAFIRPSPTGGSLGGVGRKTRESIVVCEAAGFDVVIVETVGVGQSEALVAQMVDFFLVLMLSGAGDELQGIKRGILELADLIAINKADGDNLTRARRARAELEGALRILRPPGAQTWTPEVVTCSARSGDGLDAVWDAVCRHHAEMSERGLLQDKRRQQLVRWMWSTVDEALRAAAREHPVVAAAASGLERDVVEGRVTPTRAAETILEALGVGVDSPGRS